MKPLLSIRKLKKNYQDLDGEVEALGGIDLDVYEGEILSIVGPSGCGKTSLLSILSNLENKSDGNVKFQNETIKIGYMLQKDGLLEWRTIYKNVILGLEIRGIKTKENEEYVNNLLKKYHLYEFKDKYPTQLSGGMRQRAALIRTLAIKPKILLLDEAFSALDYQTRIMVTKDVYSILRQEGITSLIVTHDISEGRFQNRHCENA